MTTNSMTGPGGIEMFGGFTPHEQPDRGSFGEQWVFRFPNGYGASVIRGHYTYGGAAGLYELGVIKFDGDDWGLTYATPVTEDVLGHLTEAEVADVLRKIEELAPATPGSAA